MARIHYLNVKEGDCSVIQHNSDHVSVIDVSNAKPIDTVSELAAFAASKIERGISGNFQQKKYPVNPISYLRDHGISSIFRYVQTHPDMDHMDGIKTLFDHFGPANFWDSDNRKELPNDSWEASPYNQEDWLFYKTLRDGNPQENPKRLTLFSGSQGQYYNLSEDNSVGGDGIQVLAPTLDLVKKANEADEDYNRCSYVLLYQTNRSRIVFGGDSHDESWEHILAHWGREVADIDLLIAPHHGRKSGRKYDFLDVLKPKLTFFGIARSEHLANDAWRRRGLSVVTNNQANCMVVDASTNPMTLYVTHENFARKVNSQTEYSTSHRAWYVGPISESLIP